MSEFKLVIQIYKFYFISKFVDTKMSLKFKLMLKQIT